MKKHFLLFLCLTAVALSNLAQSSYTLPLTVRNNDGSANLYDIVVGDKLVYRVNAGGAEYDFIVTVNEPANSAIDFNYEMTNSSNTSGHVTISSKAKSEATKYVNYFRGGDLNLSDACTVWLSNKNFSDLQQRKTVMQFDNGSPETFYLPVEEEVHTTVKIKGEDKKIEGFILNNAADGKGNKTLWVNDVSGNPLILKMDLGWTIVLKEIR